MLEKNGGSKPRPSQLLVAGQLFGGCPLVHLPRTVTNLGDPSRLLKRACLVSS